MFSSMMQMASRRVVLQQPGSLSAMLGGNLCRTISKSSEVNNSDYMTIRSDSQTQKPGRSSSSCDSKQQIRLKKVSR